MFKLFKFVFKLVAILAIVLIVYNYFAGTPEEKATSKAIVGQAKDLIGSVFGLLASEKDKFRDGKYDSAMTNISDALSKARQHASTAIDGGNQWFARLNQLDQQKQYLETQLRAMEQTMNDSANHGANDSSATGQTNFLGQAYSTEQFEAEFRQLAEQTQILIDEMQNQ